MKFVIWDYDNEDEADATEVEWAHTRREALEDWAALHDSENERCIAATDERGYTVRIREVGDTEWQEATIWAHVSFTYTAEVQ